METTPQINWITRIITLIATLNTVAIAFGVYHLDNAQLEAVDAAISSAGAIIGTWISHTK